MDKFLAGKMMGQLLEVNTAMNILASQIEQLDIESEKLLFRRGISNLMGLVYSDLMRHIIREYPELDPDS